jgi:hypothetical protein
LLYLRIYSIIYITTKEIASDTRSRADRQQIRSAENLETKQTSTGRTPEKVRNAMKNMITMCAIIANAKSLTEYAEYVCDYYDSTGYISDTFAEIADNNTSVYYSDIIRYISEHVEEVNDAINEFGWDGCDRDLYKAGQMAECNEIENQLCNHYYEIIEAYAADHIRRNYAEEIPAETWERIAAELENIDTCDRWDVIRDAVDEIMTETAEEANEMTA